jgi:hypothetical protein
MRRFFFSAFAVVSLLTARAQEQTDVNFILGRVWANMEMQPFELEGVIRHGSALHPIKLKTGPREMVYMLGGKQADIRVVFGSDKSQVFTRKCEGCKWTELPTSSWDSRVLGTDVTYRDLALDFLTWPEVKLLGRGNAKTLSAFILEAANPAGKNSNISRVRFWISSEHFVLVQAEAYNTQGDVVRRFDVNGVQRFGDFWTIKELRIAEMIPKRNLSRSRTFIEINSGMPIVAQ